MNNAHVLLFQENDSVGRKRNPTRIIWGETVLYLLALKYKCPTPEWELGSEGEMSTVVHVTAGEKSLTACFLGGKRV